MHWQYAPVDTAPLFQAAKSGDVRALAQVALTIAENSNATIAALQRQLKESQRQLEESRQEAQVQALQVRSLQMAQADAPLYVGSPAEMQRQLEESRQETHVQALQVRSLQMSQADAPLYVGPPPSSQQCSGGGEQPPLGEPARERERSLSPLGELLAEPDLAEIEQSRGASTISALEAGGTQQREPGPGFE
jgi:hypothetical protein